jgi:hypothetical protein
MEELPIVNQDQLSGIQRFIKHRRLSGLACVQVGFRTLDVVAIDRVNTDEIGTILMYAFRRGITETLWCTRRPDLMDTDFSARTECAKIPEYQQ